MSSSEVVIPEIPVSEKKKHICSTCKKLFSSVSNLNQHLKIHSKEKLYICKKCERSFLRNSHLTSHMKTCRNEEPAMMKRDESSSQADGDASHEPLVNKNTLKKTYTCEICGKTFLWKSNYARHLKTHKNEEKSIFKCLQCDSVFTRKDNFQRHSRLHENLRYCCKECDMKFAKNSNLKHHVRTQHNSKPFISNRSGKTFPRSPRKPRKQLESLNTFKTIYFNPEEDEKFDLDIFFRSIHQELCGYIDEVVEKSSLKWYLVIKIMLERNSDDEQQYITTYFHSHTYCDFTNDNIEAHLEKGYAKIKTRFEEFLQRGSGWLMKEILHLELKMAKFNSLKFNPSK